MIVQASVLDYKLKKTWINTRVSPKIVGLSVLENISISKT